MRWENGFQERDYHAAKLAYNAAVRKRAALKKKKDEFADIPYVKKEEPFSWGA
jgi:hypothetical protein